MAKCPHCQGNLVKYGKRRGVQVYYCKSCFKYTTNPIIELSEYDNSECK